MAEFEEVLARIHAQLELLKRSLSDRHSEYRRVVDEERRIFEQDRSVREKQPSSVQNLPHRKERL
jgi:hypothetical protein